MQEVNETHKELRRLLYRYHDLGYPADAVEKVIAAHEGQAIQRAAIDLESKEAENTALRAKLQDCETTLGLNLLRAETAEAKLTWIFANGHIRAQDFTSGDRDVYEIHTPEELDKSMKETT